MPCTMVLYQTLTYISYIVLESAEARIAGITQQEGQTEICKLSGWTWKGTYII